MRRLVALGAAAAAHGGPLVAIAAAGDESRGLLPPCGRCRQALLDRHPDVLVATPTADGPEMRPIMKLLPHTYFWLDAKRQRVIRFNKRYYEEVANRIKTSSVRWDENISVGSAVFYL